MKNNTILVIVKEPGRKAYPCNIENTLEAFQKLVGGYIETVRFSKELIVICNEEGRILGLPGNICGLCGTLVFCGTKGDAFAGIKAKDVPITLELLNGGNADD